MNDAKSTITLLACCCIVLTIAPLASADYVGVTTVNKDDPWYDLCTQGHGPFVPGPLTVCNVFAAFDNPEDILLSLGNADLQVYNGEDPDVFFQHPLNASPTAPWCLGFCFPDLICDTFITIGFKFPIDPSFDRTIPDGDFDFLEFQCDGHIGGGWFNAGFGTGSCLPGEPCPDFDGDGEVDIFDVANVLDDWGLCPDPPLDCPADFNGDGVVDAFDLAILLGFGSGGNGQGDAGSWPDLQVLFLQSSVAQGRSMSGDIDIFWKDGETGETIAEVDVPIECAAVEQEPCECVNGKVTLCHSPPGNRAHARTITVDCTAGDKHLAHGDSCGRCPYYYCGN